MGAAFCPPIVNKVKEGTITLLFVFLNIVRNTVLNVALNVVLNSVSLVLFITTILKILARKNLVLLNSVEEFIEIRVLLLLNFQSIKFYKFYCYILNSKGVLKKVIQNRHVFMRQSMEVLSIFTAQKLWKNFLTLKKKFLKNEKLFQSTIFKLKTLRLKSHPFHKKIPCQKPMLRKIESGVQNRPITKNEVSPVTTFFQKML